MIFVHILHINLICIILIMICWKNTQVWLQYVLSTHTFTLSTSPRHQEPVVPACISFFRISVSEMKHSVMISSPSYHLKARSFSVHKTFPLGINKETPNQFTHTEKTNLNICSSHPQNVTLQCDVVWGAPQNSNHQVESCEACASAAAQRAKIPAP